VSNGALLMASAGSMRRGVFGSAVDQGVPMGSGRGTVY
jgi:hypothetical protein